jgi:fibro-slime domain-containing protein
LERLAMSKRMAWVSAVALVSALGGCGSSGEDGPGSSGVGGPQGTSSTTPSSGGPGPTGAGGAPDFGPIDPIPPREGSGGSGGNTAQTCDGRLRGVVRDFHDTHPDMEPSHSGKSDNADDLDIVTDTIGEDFKPVYAGPVGGTVSTTGKENFDQWFRDVEGVNTSMELALQFTDTDGDGVYTHNDQEFFPIDGLLFGDDGRPHNYHFTFELHTTFKYRRGQVFTFAGDDDVFAYINGRLVVNLGGVHAERTGTVNLDRLGLTEGEEYRLDFFFAERHVTDSHFRIDTTLEFVDCGFIPR